MEVGRKPDLCWVEPAHPRTLQADLQQLGLGPAQEPQFQFLIWQHSTDCVPGLQVQPPAGGPVVSSSEDGGSFFFSDLGLVPEQEDTV